MKIPQFSPFTEEALIQIGMAAVLHNYQQAVDVLQGQMDMLKQFRVERGKQHENGNTSHGPALGTAREALDEARKLLAAPARKEKEKEKDPRRKKQANSYWATLSPEERKHEMQRRMTVRLQKRAGLPVVKTVGLHPRDVGHPGHAAWLKTMRKSSKGFWDRLTPEARQERLRNLQAAKAKAAKARSKAAR